MKRTQVIVIDAMLIAMYRVLSLFNIKLTPNWTISLITLPIIVAAMLMGPVHGAIVGFGGSFIGQMLSYGFTATTLLWIMPHCVAGLVCGLLAKAFKYEYSRKNVIICSVAAAFTTTALNSVAFYYASKIEGWWFKGVAIANLPNKIVIGIGLSIAYTILLPPILKEARKIVVK